MLEAGNHRLEALRKTPIQLRPSKFEGRLAGRVTTPQLNVRANIPVRVSTDRGVPFVRLWRCSSAAVAVELVVVMMRDGALALSRSSSSVVNRNGARWLRAQVSSMPSALSCRDVYMAPALLMRISSLAWRASTSAASLRTAACDDRCDERADGRAGRCRVRYARGRNPGSRLVAADDRNVGTARRQGLGRSQADAVRGASDQDLLAVESVLVHGRSAIRGR